MTDSGSTDDGGVITDLSPNTITFSVTSVSDAPAGADKPITILEDATYTFAAADFGFSDTKDNPADTLVSVTITELPLVGTLKLGLADVTLNQVITLAEIPDLKYTPGLDANGADYAAIKFAVTDSGSTDDGGVITDLSPNTITFSVTSVSDAPAGADKPITILEDATYTFAAAEFGFSDTKDNPADTLVSVTITELPLVGTLKLGLADVTLNQVITLAEIPDLKYTPGLDANGADYAAIKFAVTDSGSTDDGGVITDLSPNTITFSVTSVSDAPAGADKPITILEDATYTFAAADFGFSDTKDNPADTLVSVTITELPLVGTLKLGLADVTLNQVITLAEIPDLKYTPGLDANGADYAAIKFAVTDSGSTDDGGVITDLSPNTITFSVTSVSDAPAGADKPITILEDATYTFAAADFGFSDTKDNPADTLVSVTITELPLVGTLKLGLADVTLNQVITLAEIPDLKYTPGLDANGADYAAIKFAVTDSGSTDDGGVITDLSPNTITFSVTSVSDAPAGADKPITILEDATYTFAAADFGFSDTKDNPADTLVSVTITELPLVGTLKLGLADVTLNQVITLAEIPDLKYTPGLDANGADYAAIKFAVTDSGSTDDGGVITDLSPNTITFSVTSVSDAPAGADKPITILEDATYTFAAADFGFSDTKDNPADTLVSVTITELPLVGTLKLGLADVTLNQVITLAEIPDLKYTPGLDANGADYAAIKFAVTDSGSTDDGGVITDLSPNTITFSVTSVSDAPAGADKPITILEDATYTFAAADFGFSDTKDNPADTLVSVTITELPLVGTLKLGLADVTLNQVITLAEIPDLKYTPGLDANGADYAAIKFAVTDSGSTDDGGVITDLSPNTITFSVTSVSDAPAGADKPITILEDATYTFAAADFGFSDTKDNPADTLVSVTITELPLVGTLKLGLADVTLNQVITLAEIPDLKYTPGLDANGADYAAIKFAVTDSGSTDDGGVITDLSPNTITFSVTSVSDAPAGADKPITILEDATYTFAAADFGFSDTKDNPADTLVSVTITELPLVGTLKLGLADVTLNQVITLAEIPDLKYTPGLDANGADYAAIKFAVTDSGSTDDGGVITDLSPNTITFSVTSVSDAPAGADKPITILEDATYTFAAADFGFSDTKDNPADTLVSVTITELPLVGTLKLGLADVTLNQVITLAEIPDLKYTPGLDANGADYAAIKFAVTDSGSTDDGGCDNRPESEYDNVQRDIGFRRSCGRRQADHDP